jgi:hypothetical protein
MLFTERVATWEARLFTHVPRAADNDENYARIRAKNFQSVREPLVVNLPAEVPPVQEKPLEEPLHFIPPTPTNEVPMVTPPTIMQPVISTQQEEPTLNNTPFQGGIVLPGKPEDKKEDKFIEPGSTFTFGEEK